MNVMVKHNDPRKGRCIAWVLRTRRVQIRIRLCGRIPEGYKPARSAMAGVQ